MPDYDELRERFQANAQEHIFAEFDKLPAEQRDELLEDCAMVDFAWLKARWAEFQEVEAHGVPKKNIETIEVTPLPKGEGDLARVREVRAAGEDKLRQGKVAAFLVAGGQGTRLGYDGPKGRYPIGPITDRSLFQWHAEKILARSRRYQAAIPWYIMTSRDNDRDTRQFFAEKSFFGLNPNDVFFFTQEMVPSIDFEGKLMLASPSRLAMNPNGHGGSLSGLYRSGAIADMEKRGIEVISYFQVDNPLVTIADPVFVGWHTLSGSEMSSKVLEKSSPSERIGVVCRLDGKPAVVEYTDLDPETMQAKGEDGRLKFWAGSIAIHMIDVDFAKRMGSEGRLAWHMNKKKVAFFSGNRLIKPGKENAVKFETFVFDALPHCKKTFNMEVAREREFAPVKNAEGVDSVESCRDLLARLFADWLAECEVQLPLEPMVDGGKAPVVEISPLYSLDAEELASKVKPGGVKLERRMLLE